MRFKSVMTWEPAAMKVRLLRLMWERGTFGKGGYSACFSLALVPSLFRFKRKANDFRFVALGVSFHYMRSYGGRYA